MKYHIYFLLYLSCFTTYSQQVEVKLNTTGSVNFLGGNTNNSTLNQDSTLRYYQDGQHIKIISLSRYNGQVHSPIFINVSDKTPLQFSTKNGDVSLSNLQNNVTGTCQEANLSISNVQGKVQLKTLKGNIQVVNSSLQGSISTQEGEIVIENPSQQLGLFSSSLPQVSFTQSYLNNQRLNYQTSYANLQTAIATKGANLRILEGAIQMQGSSKTTRIKIAKSGNINLIQAQDSIYLYTQSGSIDLSLANTSTYPLAPVILESQAGNITIEVPNNFNDSISVEMSQTRDLTQINSISSDINFSKNELISLTNESGQTAGYRRIGLYVQTGGRRCLRIRTQNGNVIIRKRSF